MSSSVVVIHCQNIIRVVSRRRSGRRDAQKEKRRRSPLVDFHQSRRLVVVACCCSRVKALIKIRIDFDRSRKRKKQNTNEATRDDDDDDDEEDSHHHENAPLHDFGSNGSSESTSSGVHPTDKRIVGLSFPSTGVPVLPPRGAADDDDDMPKMPADATTPSAT